MAWRLQWPAPTWPTTQFESQTRQLRTKTNKQDMQGACARAPPRRRPVQSPSQAPRDSLPSLPDDSGPLPERPYRGEAGFQAWPVHTRAGLTSLGSLSLSRSQVSPGPFNSQGPSLGTMWLPGLSPSLRLLPVVAAGRRVCESERAPATGCGRPCIPSRPGGLPGVGKAQGF